MPVGNWNVPESWNVLGNWLPEAVARFFIVIVKELFDERASLVVSVTFVLSSETAMPVNAIPPMPVAVIE